jgi:hypothetical protein
VIDHELDFEIGADLVRCRFIRNYDGLPLKIIGTLLDLVTIVLSVGGVWLW